jgi:hypothetical protein
MIKDLMGNEIQVGDLIARAGGTYDVGGMHICAINRIQFTPTEVAYYVNITPGDIVNGQVMLCSVKNNSEKLLEKPLGTIVLKKAAATDLVSYAQIQETRSKKKENKLKNKIQLDESVWEYPYSMSDELKNEIINKFINSLPQDEWNTIYTCGNAFEIIGDNSDQSTRTFYLPKTGQVKVGYSSACTAYVFYKYTVRNRALIIKKINGVFDWDIGTY